MTDLPERVASAEAKLGSHEREIGELERQRAAMWSRVDAIQAAIDQVKLDAARSEARLETKMADMDKTSLRESFGMKSQIAEIGWRVGIIVGAALLILNFVLSKIDIGSMFHNDPPKKSAR